MPEGPLRLLIIDDHAMFRGGIARALGAEPGFQIAGECASVAEARAALATTKVDVVLLDIDLGAENGREFLRGLLPDQRPKVVVVTGGISEHEAYALLKAEVEGVVLKHEPVNVLSAAIRRVAQGQRALEAPWIQTVLARVQAEQSEMKPLTRRERDVLRSVLEGLPTKEIAFRLDSSEPAVKSVIQQLFDKTGVRTRAQLVRVALERYPDELENVE